LTEDSIDPAPEPGSAFGDELPPGTQLCYGQYTIDKYLNSGGFGVTYLTRDSLGRRVVIKECFPNIMCCRAGDLVRLRSLSYEADFVRIVELFEKEARALAHLQHPNVVGVHQIFKDNGTAYMALDYVEGMDLLDVYEKTPEVLTADVLVALLKSLLTALSYVHANGILHRDISPDNILLDHTNTPVLIDFGAAREGASRASRILSRVHTVKDGYSPQEFYFAGSKQSPSSDLYALAATFYHLITGDPPPNSNQRLAAVAENRPDPFVPLASRFPEFDPAVLASIDTCLNLFSKDRIESASAWLEAIEHKQQSAPASEVLASTEIGVEAIIAKLVDEHRKIMEEKENTPTDVSEPVEEPPTEDPKAAAEREYWSILNEDPSEWRAELEAEQRAEMEAKQALQEVDVIKKLQTPAPEPAELEPPEIDLSAKRIATAKASNRRFSIAALLPWADQGRDDTQKHSIKN